MRTLLTGVVVAAVLAFAAPGWAKGGPAPWRFAMSKGGKVLGRFDVNQVRNDEGVFATGFLYPGAAAVKDPGRPRPSLRSSAQLEKDGSLGKYKRWEAKGGKDLYWFAFVYEGVVKVRFEKGAGDKGRVKEAGKGEHVSPLDAGQPQLAWVLVATSTGDREVSCIAARDETLGKATVRRGAEEQVDLPAGAKASLTRWDVKGDCGAYSIFVDKAGEPVVMVEGDTRYDRIADK